MLIRFIVDLEILFMKYFVAIVICLIGLGAYLRFQNESSLKERVEVSDEGQSKLSQYSHKKSHGQKNFQKNPTYNNLNNGQNAEENAAMNTMPPESDTNYNDVIEATCPFTDANGFCATEPLMTTDADYIQEENLANNPDHEVEVLQLEDNDYEKYLNDQTFETIRTPASEE